MAEPATSPEPTWPYPPSPSGPADDAPLTEAPPQLAIPAALQGLRMGGRTINFMLDAQRRLGDVWTLRIPMRPEGLVMTAHPDHAAALVKSAVDAPSITGESPLGQILGPDSVLTSVGERHLRQRKMLLPPFHGEAVQRYVEMIEKVVEREIDGWTSGAEFALAPRMQAVTLDVIMRGVFGVDGADHRSAAGRMRAMVRRVLNFSTTTSYQLIELRNVGRSRPRDSLATLVKLVDRHMYEVIRARRAAPSDPTRTDVLSLLLAARDEDGQALTDRELRDELMALVLAGHETTANTLAWTFERLLRTPAAYDALRDAVRSGDRARSAEYVEATIHEGMRTRPVIPLIARRVQRRWRLGDYVVAPGTSVGVSIVALHHRSDVYPEPAVFRPERFLDRKPGTYTWMPFGGGIRRCLGASLALAEMRVVLEAIARRTDMAAPDPAPEGTRLRNVTVIPSRGGRVRITACRAA